MSGSCSRRGSWQQFSEKEIFELGETYDRRHCTILRSGPTYTKGAYFPQFKSQDMQFGQFAGPRRRTKSIGSTNVMKLCSCQSRTVAEDLADAVQGSTTCCGK